MLNCRHCKEEFEKANEKNNKKKNNYILSNENSITKKPKLLFMTAIGILSIFNIFNIFFFNQPLQKIRNIRNLSFNDQSEIIINNNLIFEGEYKNGKRYNGTYIIKLREKVYYFIIEQGIFVQKKVEKINPNDLIYEGDCQNGEGRIINIDGKYTIGHV